MANAVRRIVLLQSSVDELKMQVQDLNQRFDALQRQFDEQSGQLIILASFVQKALDERVDEAVNRALERVKLRPVRRNKKTRRQR